MKKFFVITITNRILSFIFVFTQEKMSIRYAAPLIGSSESRRVLNFWREYATWNAAV